MAFRRCLKTQTKLVPVDNNEIWLVLIKFYFSSTNHVTIRSTPDSSEILNRNGFGGLKNLDFHSVTKSSRRRWKIENLETLCLIETH